MKLHGSGFIVSQNEAKLLGLGRRPGLERHVRPYLNGRDLTGHSRNAMVIDLFGLPSEKVRDEYPEIYQHLLSRVRYDYDDKGVPRRNKNGDRLGREWNRRESYRENWWVFGEPRGDIRPALENIDRYAVTPVTQKYRFFLFVDAEFLPDDALMCFAEPTGFILATLSSRIFEQWFAANSSTLEDRPRFIKSSCFDPFPFPDPSEYLKRELCKAGEELDTLRKKVLAEHTDLTLTGLYNVLEKLKLGSTLSDNDEEVKRRGLVLILEELHETIDRLTEEAYGWPTDLSEEQILERLVALNAERAVEEATGHVRWLRPDYQIPRFAKGAAAKTGELDLGEKVAAIDTGKPVFPKDRYEQPLAVEALLSASTTPLDAAAISRAFKGGGKKIEQRVAQVLLTLARYGRVTPLSGGKFAARKAA
ncbi:hypothetical protein [Mesorhizobium sp. M1322]|uniref:hypothetical protein n=1 Tax=Mesorhizobium sp. M1322 TaxID=2957081 RepID=UPI0033364DEE